MFPDVVISVSRSKKSGVKSFVLDCEIVAYELDKHETLPYQILSTRRRKHVALIEIKVQFCIFAFDILYLNGNLIYEQQLVPGRIRIFSVRNCITVDKS